MNIKNYDDCLKAAEKTGVSADAIAETYGIKTPREQAIETRLKKAIKEDDEKELKDLWNIKSGSISDDAYWAWKKVVQKKLEKAIKEDDEKELKRIAKEGPVDAGREALKALIKIT